MNREDRILGAAVVSFLQGHAARPPAGKDAEALGIAIECISEFFDVSTLAPTESSVSLRQLFQNSSQQQQQQAPDAAPAPAAAVAAAAGASEFDRAFAQYIAKLASTPYFDNAPEGSARHAELTKQAREKFAQKFPELAAADADRRRRAEACKEQGNELVHAGDFRGAVAAYTNAIALVPDAIYYCNRAAAYANLEDAKHAEDDARSALALDATYTKAYRRLGQALMMQNRHRDAMEPFRKALELEPGNAMNEESLAECEAVCASQTAPPRAAPGAMPAMPDLSGIDLNNLDMGSLMSNPQLAGLMSNPAIASMAQQALRNPAMLQNIMQMFGGAGAPGAGAPRS